MNSNLLINLTNNRISSSPKKLLGNTRKRTGSGSELHDLRHLQKVIFDEKWSDVTIENATDDIGVLSVVGPNSKDVLAKSLQKNMDDWKFLDARKVSSLVLFAQQQI